jgi:hypothetical protein
MSDVEDLGSLNDCYVTQPNGKRALVVNSGGEPLSVVLEGGGSTVAPIPFNLAINQGLVEGHSVVDKFGRNTLITTASDPEDCWEAGGTYNYDPDGTAPIVSLISDDASDTMIILVQGLDVNREEVIQFITLNGTTRVALDTPLWRVYRMISLFANISGTVYCYTGTGGVPALADTRAIMQAGNNQTLMAIYTIPAGKVGFLYKGGADMSWEGGAFSGTEFANCRYESRRLGEVFTVKRTFTLMSSGDSKFKDERSFPDTIPSGTDIKITIEEVSATMGVNGAFDILLVDEDQFTTEFLQNIGQPGY